MTDTTIFRLVNAPGLRSVPEPSEPVFERAANATLDKVKGIYAQRGQQYNDTWHTDNQCDAVTRATLLRFGIDLSPEQVRLLQLAALIDVKDSRLIGEWHPDSMYDGLAYRSVYTTLRSEWEATQQP